MQFNEMVHGGAATISSNAGFGISNSGLVLLARAPGL
jgi:hypothetical protein